MVLLNIECSMSDLKRVTSIYCAWSATLWYR